MAVWDDVLPDTDRKVFKAAGWGRPGGLGRRPVLLLIDVNYNFVGDRPEPILDTIKRWRYSCDGHLGNEIVAEVAPRPGDLLVEKKKPSAFFGTPLVSYLVALRADTLLDGLEPGLFDAEFPAVRDAGGVAR